MAKGKERPATAVMPPSSPVMIPDIQAKQDKEHSATTRILSHIGFGLPAAMVPSVEFNLSDADWLHRRLN